MINTGYTFGGCRTSGEGRRHHGFSEPSIGPGFNISNIARTLGGSLRVGNADMHNYSRKQINQMNSMSMHKNFSIVIFLDITSSCPRGLTKQLLSWTLVAKRESVVIVYLSILTEAQNRFGLRGPL